MAKVTVIFGGLLIILGVAGYVLTHAQSVTALIPAFAGVVFAVLGGVALRPAARKHAMHAAAALALLGFLGTVPGVIKLAQWAGGTAPARPAAVISQSIMAALCLIFLLLCIRSFVQARRNPAA